LNAASFKSLIREMSHLLPHRLRGKVQALPATQAMLHRLADLATPRAESRSAIACI
jgi:hypothetical protein